jgi:hypothetical protein
MPPSDAVIDDDGTIALADLRRARRRRRLANLDRFESLYRAYLAGFLGSLAIVLLSNLAGDRKLTPSETATLLRQGPAAIGLLLAVSVAVGVRSGGRGGPLALAAADVRHVLLAPVDRAVALRGPALRQLRTGAFAGFVVGGVVGVNASHRLPHPALVWVGVGAAVGLATALAAYGAALAAGGARLGRRVGGLLALLLLAWQGVDVAEHLTTTPFTLLGSFALTPLRFHPLDLAGFAIVVLVPLGLALVGGMSLEAAEERSRLVGQMKFGATLGDVRTVLVLRRQLAQEHPRARPWIPVARPSLRLVAASDDTPGAGGTARTGAAPPGTTKPPGVHLPTGVVVRRSMWGIVRWPLGRIARMFVLAGAAGVAACGAWNGTKALLVPAGLCAYIAALDAIEPLAQQLDHPDRSDSLPRVAGQLRLRLLVVPIVLMALLGLVAVGSAIAAGAPAALTFQVGLPTALAAGVMACCGAAVSTIKGPDFGGSSILMSPEVQGVREIFLFGFPIACSVVGLLPILGGQAALHKGLDPGTGAMQAVLPILGVLGFLVLGWVRFREDVQRFFAEANESAKEQSRAKAERPDEAA